MWGCEFAKLFLQNVLKELYTKYRPANLSAIQQAIWNSWLANVA